MDNKDIKGIKKNHANMSGNLNYWENRAKRYGHTGWSDFSTYYYDQNLRLIAIENLIKGLNIENKLALDYGCGIGDFSIILSKYFSNIIATDISTAMLDKAKKINNHPNISYKKLEEDIFHEKYDFILSITVLQHILSDRQLTDVLSAFSSSLNITGKLIVLESFSSDASNSNYIKLRPFETSIQIFKNSGFRLQSKYEFYHPAYLPTKLFKKYNSRFIVRILNRLCSYGIPGCKKLLKSIAKKESNSDFGIIADESMTKILVFERDEI